MILSCTANVISINWASCFWWHRLVIGVNVEQYRSKNAATLDKAIPLFHQLTLFAIQPNIETLYQNITPIITIYLYFSYLLYRRIWQILTETVTWRWYSLNQSQRITSGFIQLHAFPTLPWDLNCLDTLKSVVSSSYHFYLISWQLYVACTKLWPFLRLWNCTKVKHHIF